VTFAAVDPARLARFWADLLARVVVADGDAALLPGDDTQLGLRFAPGAARQAGSSRMHLHLTSESLDHRQATVAAARGLGASHLDVGQRPEEGHLVLADPEGYAFCVIEPGNAYLAGCGFLGELACDGTRSVGVFWSEALQWPLVWDQDEETAIQSPDGGTKIAWGGPPVTAQEATCRQHLDLGVGVGDRAAEIERLVGLGASRVTDRNDTHVLADPDGNRFTVRAG
jgi:hypothetical protein